jgi:levanbiose-producing levanase
VLVDRTSIEIFGNGGELSFTACFLPDEQASVLSLRVEGGSSQIVSLKAFPLRSAWR